MVDRGHRVYTREVSSLLSETLFPVSEGGFSLGPTRAPRDRSDRDLVLVKTRGAVGQFPRRNTLRIVVRWHGRPHVYRRVLPLQSELHFVACVQCPKPVSVG